MKRFVRRHLPSLMRPRRAQSDLDSPKVLHAKPGSWIATSLGVSQPVRDDRLFGLIQRRREITQDFGAQPLWSGYAAAGLEGYPLDIGPHATRTPEQVSTSDAMGRFFTQVVVQRQPKLIVEVGTGFGGSGMYWLAGLEVNASGHLLTFEPNGSWAPIARNNLAAVGTRFDVVGGVFEDNLAVVDERVDGVGIAFIDAIHTCEVVLRQIELIKSRSAPEALIFLDDIDFSTDMSACWDALKTDEQYSAAAEIGRVGIIELNGDD